MCRAAGLYKMSKEKECPHCEEILSRQAFHRHKTLFFRNGIWRKKKNINNKVKEGSADVDKANIQSAEDFSISNDNAQENSYEDIQAELLLDSDINQDQRINAEVWNEATDPLDDFDNDTAQQPLIFENNNEKLIVMFMYQLFALQTTYSISDSVMGIILKLIHSFLTQLQKSDGINKLETMVELFPATLFCAKQKINLENNSFEKYVSCPDCHSLYKLEDCSLEKDGKRESACCSHIPFPEHPQARFREPCGQTLMKSVSSGDGKKNYLYPKRMYCYQPVRQSLQNLISRNDLREKILEGPTKGPSGVLLDTVDGKFWKDFKDSDDEPYFNDSRNLGGILNIDWFQPFDGVEHSCGVIYMALLNLPREIRFKWENITTVGIIPGPNEPSLNVNSYIRPLVDDLLQLWEGQLFDEDQCQAIYKFALCCISSDLPATRKLCGFLSYNAKQGCSKCFKQFEHEGPVGTTTTDYSGFNEDDWDKRERGEHVRLAFKHKAAKTLAEAKETEYDYGVRYSELCRLSYYDPIRCHLIDPMHCLLLGVAKKTLKIWIQTNVLTKEKLEIADKQMSLIKLPPGYGVLPSAVSAAFKKMKSDEYKTWVLYTSLFVLKDLLPEAHYDMWEKFVRACHLLIKPHIILEDVDTAHNLLKAFNESFEEVIGRDKCVPNMHMMMHIKDCILDFGPVYAFWCYSFERFNGKLGEYQTNNRSITMQLMRQFCDNHSIFTAYQQLDMDGIPSFEELKLTSRIDEDLKHLVPLCSYRIGKTDLSSMLMSRHSTFLSAAKFRGLDRKDVECITHYLRTVLSIPGLKIQRIVQSYSRIKIGRDVIASSSYRKNDNRNQFIFISFQNQNHPGFVSDIIDIPINLPGNEDLNIPFFQMSLFKTHDYKNFYGQECPMKIWDTQVMTEIYVPVVAMKGKCVVIPSNCEFDRIPIANGRLAKANFGDKVYFVMEM